MVGTLWFYYLPIFFFLFLAKLHQKQRARQPNPSHVWFPRIPQPVSANIQGDFSSGQVFQTALLSKNTPAFPRYKPSSDSDILLNIAAFVKKSRPRLPRGKESRLRMNLSCHKAQRGSDPKTVRISISQHFFPSKNRVINSIFDLRICRAATKGYIPSSNILNLF